MGNSGLGCDKVAASFCVRIEEELGLRFALQGGLGGEGERRRMRKYVQSSSYLRSPAAVLAFQQDTCVVSHQLCAVHVDAVAAVQRCHRLGKRILACRKAWIILVSDGLNHLPRQ